jgi:hypothetical protein
MRRYSLQASLSSAFANTRRAGACTFPPHRGAVAAPALLAVKTKKIAETNRNVISRIILLSLSTETVRLNFP